MKQLFHIVRRGVENVQPVLSLRLGEKHASFAITDNTGNELYELAWCNTEDPAPLAGRQVTIGWNENSLAEFFTGYPSLHHSFFQVIVAYDTPQSILTPTSFYNSEEAEMLLKIMHGIPAGSHIISELISEWQLYNTYAVPDEVYNWVHQKFPAARSWHQYSLAVKKLIVADQGAILVDFKKDDFTLLVAANSRLLLAQSFPYSTPGDIVYYILKTCQQFSLSQHEVNLQLSGLIDKESALYKELHQYFIHIEFREAGWNGATDYPAHFFTSLNDLAQCAS